jgi:hypothetical protein
MCLRMPGASSDADMVDAQEPKTLEVPWKGRQPDEVVANLAIGSLRESLLTWLKTERGVHVETLLVAIGAIAGCAAQAAAWLRLAKRDFPLSAEATTSSEAYSTYLRSSGLMLTVTTKSGETFYFGDLINAYLVHEPALQYPYPLWGIIAGAELSSGLNLADLPDASAMFGHIAETLGGADFGVPTTGREHQPQVPERRLLNLLWPRAKWILSYTDGPGPAKGHSVAPEHWPLITALVANQLVQRTKGVLDTGIGFRLVMESAIAMSKVDQKTVPQTWQPQQKP